MEYIPVKINEIKKAAFFYDKENIKELKKETVSAKNVNKILLSLSNKHDKHPGMDLNSHLKFLGKYKKLMSKFLTPVKKSNFNRF